MSHCPTCGNIKTFDNISCRHCSDFKKLEQAIARKRTIKFLTEGWLKACDCGKIAKVVTDDKYLCEECHG